MSVILSPNMNLPIPTVGSENGPNYALDINQSLNILDGHTHAPGSGSQITPAGLNINAALTLNNNFLINIAGLTLTAQGSAPANSTIYESGTDLYFVDGLGNNVRLTQSGAVAGTPGSIANLVPPASASYVALSSTFVFQSNASIAANLDAGSVVFRNTTPNSTFGVTVQPPAALGADSTLTLPAVPATPSFVTINASGTMGALSLSGQLTTANLSSTAGITGGQIAANTITGSNIVSGIDLPGTNVKANGQTVVVANTNPSSNNLAVVSSRFDQTTILSGEGISVGNPSPGTYNIVFTNTFSAPPSCVATCENGGARVATITSVTVSGCTVNSFDLAGTKVQTPINFIAIGQKV